MASPIAKHGITAERLREMFHYDSATGVFTRLESVGGERIGDVAGRQASGRYVRFRVSGKDYLAHRLAWLWMTGSWPIEHIDHRDGNGANNSWDNLREATASENHHNHKIGTNNKSGFIGVYWHKKQKKWAAQICLSAKIKYLGLFSTPEEASEAYLAAKAEMHPTQPVPRHLLQSNQSPKQPIGGNHAAI